MLERYKEYLESELTKKLLPDGTTVFCDDTDKRLIKLYAPLSELKIDYLDAQYALYSYSYKRGEHHLPEWYKQFLSESNGLDILFSTLSLQGYQVIDRTNFELNSPCDLITETNCFRSNYIPKDMLGIGVFGYNHSDIFVNEEGKVYVYNGDYEELLKKRGKKALIKFLETDVELLIQYDSFEEFLLTETKRLLELYHKEPWDYLTVRAETVPNYVKK